jgi:hypothetical protein
MARQWRPNSVPREARRRQERPMLQAWYVLPSAQRHDHAPMGTWRIQANPLSRATEDPNQRPQRAPYFLKVYEQLPRRGSIPPPQADSEGRLALGRWTQACCLACCQCVLT